MAASCAFDLPGRARVAAGFSCFDGRVDGDVFEVVCPGCHQQLLRWG
jgi:hypothetical protein